MFWRKSHLLTTILTSGLRLWLTSQLDTVQNLQLSLISSDRQLLQGMIPKAILKSEFAIYQGLQFDQISLTAEDIWVNLSHLFKGEPLEPLNPIPLSGNVRMSETHLNASLASSLLQSGIKDFLSLLLKTDALSTFHWEKITLHSQQFILQGKTLSSSPKPVSIQAQVSLNSPQQLLISPIAVEGIDCTQELNPLEFDLGSQVHLEDLNITPSAIFLQGTVRVN